MLFSVLKLLSSQFNELSGGWVFYWFWYYICRNRECNLKGKYSSVFMGR